MARVRDDLTVLSGYHSPQVDVDVRLNTNEAPAPPSDGVVRAMLERIADLELNRYPDRQASELRRLLGLRHGLDPSMLHVGNGSNEVLQHILLAFGGPGRTAVTFGPTYQMHSHIAAITGTSVVDFGRGADGRIDPGCLHQDQARDIVFITSPNNPTGLAESHDTVRGSIVPWCAETDAVLVIDEAYVEFAPEDLL
ncbi:MAG: aminotransferase class I/II-fold pyridoxal phosphate-dependent enzyme, partial [Ilumatobacteraceae bacterium]